MKLWYSKTSPFARKTLVVALELGLGQRLELQAVEPATLEQQVSGDNPLGKIPCLITDDGERLYDSPVICEYLDVGFGGGRLCPAAGAARWAALTLQALADGIMDAAVLCRYEALRPEGERSAGWAARQTGKILRALDGLEATPPDGPASIGQIALACALGYLDFRMPELAWRDSRPKLARWYDIIAERPALMATAPA